MTNQKNLKGFIRIDGSGRIIAGSLILRKNMPKVGKWQEIPVYNRFLTAEIECCTSTPGYACMSYALYVIGAETASYTYDDCTTGESVGPIEMVGPVSNLICARVNSLSTTGPININPLGECESSTTTTTTTTP